MQPQLNVQQLDLLARTITSSEQLAGLINNLLNVSRIERGALASKTHPNQMGGLRKKTWPLTTKKHAEGQHRQFHVKLPKTLPITTIDASGMAEVLNNLIENAINHTTAANGVIEIEARKVGNEIETLIIDNGEAYPRTPSRNCLPSFTAWRACTYSRHRPRPFHHSGHYRSHGGHILGRIRSWQRLDLWLSAPDP